MDSARRDRTGGLKSWGPIAQATGGLTFASGLPDLPPAGWGYSYMDHHGGYFMCMGILAALRHRQATGEGQWVDMSCSEAAAAQLGPSVLDCTVNGRRVRRPGSPNSNRDATVTMVPHGIYRTRGADNWIAFSCRDDGECADCDAAHCRLMSMTACSLFRGPGLSPDGR